MSQLGTKRTHRAVLDYAAPYEWDTLIAFLGSRATPGVEVVAPSRYRRAIATPAGHGVIDVRPQPDQPSLVVDVRVDDPGAASEVLTKVRRMFDLELDPLILAAHFAGDALLAPRLAVLPGIRLPRAWDPFELAVRAILGQQVSVRAATTLASRVAATHGTPLRIRNDENIVGVAPPTPTPPAAIEGDDPAWLFPEPARLVNAPLESLGVMPARARSIRALAGAVLDGQLVLDPSDRKCATAAELIAVPGIGPWTAAYIAMRGFGDPDAFPSGDLVLQRAAGCTARELEQRSQAWRPWRAYAVMLLWQAPIQ